VFRSKLVKKFFNLLQASPADLRLRDEPEESIPRQNNCKLAVDEAFLGQLLEGQLRLLKYQSIMKTPGTISC